MRMRWAIPSASSSERTRGVERGASRLGVITDEVVPGGLGFGRSAILVAVLLHRVFRSPG